jgi:HEPN domain-containing protein
MRKFIFSLFILTILLAGCKSTLLKPYVPAPSKKSAGCVAGMIQLTTDRRFWDLKEGTYNNNLIVFVRNLSSNITYRTYSKNGFFYFYNLPSGEYELNKWQIDIPTGKDITVFLMSDIKDISFTVKNESFTIVKTILVKAEIPKDFTYKNNYFITLTDPDAEKIKNDFSVRDHKELYKNFNWMEPVLTDKIDVRSDNSRIIKQLVSSSDNDYFSMENLYKSGDYYLSFMLFYRIEESLLKGIYVSQIDKNIPQTADLKDFAKKIKIDLNADQMLLLYDLSMLNKRIKEGSKDENFKSIFTKEYFDSYLMKINDLRDYLKKSLPK